MLIETQLGRSVLHVARDHDQMDRGNRIILGIFEVQFMVEYEVIFRLPLGKPNDQYTIGELHGLLQDHKRRQEIRTGKAA